MKFFVSIYSRVLRFEWENVNEIYCACFWNVESWVFPERSTLIWALLRDLKSGCRFGGIGSELINSTDLFCYMMAGLSTDLLLSHKTLHNRLCSCPEPLTANPRRKRQQVSHQCILYSLRERVFFIFQ